MTNLEYLEKAKKCDDNIDRDIDRIANNSYPNNVGWAREIRLTFRQTKALEIIAEALCKIDVNMNVFSTVIEAVTNQGRSVNVDARVDKGGN